MRFAVREPRNQFDANTGGMTKYTFTVAGAADTGTLAWNANGTLASLNIGDARRHGGGL